MAKPPFKPQVDSLRGNYIHVVESHRWCAGEGAEIVGASGGEEVTAGATGGYELAVGDASGKILGSRDFARYYRQNHKPIDGRKSPHLATVQQR
jgi:hypothetical protein